MTTLFLDSVALVSGAYADMATLFLHSAALVS